MVTNTSGGEGRPGSTPSKRKRLRCRPLGRSRRQRRCTDSDHAGSDRNGSEGNQGLRTFNISGTTAVSGRDADGEAEYHEDSHGDTRRQRRTCINIKGETGAIGSILRHGSRGGSTTVEACRAVERATTVPEHRLQRRHNGDLR